MDNFARIRGHTNHVHSEKPEKQEEGAEKEGN